MQLFKEKVDWPESVVWFFKGFGKNFLDGSGHWMSRENESSASINFRCQKYVQ